MNVDAITNSVMMVMQQEMERQGLPCCHRHYDGNRKLIRGMIAIMVASQQKEDEQNDRPDR